MATRLRPFDLGGSCRRRRSRRRFARRWCRSGCWRSCRSCSRRVSDATSAPRTGPTIRWCSPGARSPTSRASPPNRLVAFSFHLRHVAADPGTGRRARGAPHRAAEELRPQCADCALLHRCQHVDRGGPGRDVRRQRRDRGDVARPVRRRRTPSTTTSRNVHYTLDEPDHVVAGSGVAGEGDRSARRRLGLVDLPLRERRHARPGRRSRRRSSTTTSTCSRATTRRPTSSVRVRIPRTRRSRPADTRHTSRTVGSTTRSASLRVARRTSTSSIARSRASPGRARRTEGTFSTGGGAFIANKSGPVRAIRSYLGANSGTYTQRDEIMYEGRMDVTTYLRVHPIPPLRDWMDYSADAIGMQYFTSTTTGRRHDRRCSRLDPGRSSRRGRWCAVRLARSCTRTHS